MGQIKRKLMNKKRRNRDRKQATRASNNNCTESSQDLWEGFNYAITIDSKEHCSSIFVSSWHSLNDRMSQFFTRRSIPPAKKKGNRNARQVQRHRERKAAKKGARLEKQRQEEQEKEIKSFLGLPRELRDQIYHCVNIVGPPVFKTETLAPTTIVKQSGLAGVSQQVRQEYLEALDRDKYNLPLHHLKINTHDKGGPTDLDFLQRATFRDLYLVLNDQQPGDLANRDIQPSRLDTRRMRSKAAFLRRALRKFPHLERIVLEFSGNDTLCRCTSLKDRWARNLGWRSNLDGLVVKLAVLLGFRGTMPGWTSPWPQRYLCQYCSLMRSLIVHAPNRRGVTVTDFPLAREEIIMTTRGWGTHNKKIMTKKSVRRFCRKRGVEGKRRWRYQFVPASIMPLTPFDPMEHRRWAKVMDEMKITRREYPHPSQAARQTIYCIDQFLHPPENLLGGIISALHIILIVLNFMGLAYLFKAPLVRVLRLL